MRKKALAAIEKHGILLVYPIQNQKDPASLWYNLFPRTPMRWEWDAGGDHKVSDLWLLKEELSRSNLVVYTKWYQNRATFFSKEVFVNMIAYLRSDSPLSNESTTILEALEMDSPLSTKQIKEAAELQGKFMEAAYNRAMKALWQRLLVVAWGEVEDSSFPSLAVGATKNIYEDLWNEAARISPKQAEAFLNSKFTSDNKFWKFAQKIRKTF
ncbi:AlkZ-related protein [Bdellovibrio svalbardensis]|uniref:Uncharacterized protein n=1 Tax=Bdellovibrio svalbardensis TaxID=2972972 RepID=A0ABT6DH11_9BACT|nr:hypothetical protein [Bdellovibrio svalbardensis]MDG0816102.1 hypothetical protein [Bdellovibrio svalbardensis]